jgi:hypothetical protein
MGSHDDTTTTVEPNDYEPGDVVEWSIRGGADNPPFGRTVRGTIEDVGVEKWGHDDVIVAESHRTGESCDIRPDDIVRVVA